MKWERDECAPALSTQGHSAQCLLAPRWGLSNREYGLAVVATTGGEQTHRQEVKAARARAAYATCTAPWNLLGRPQRVHLNTQATMERHRGLVRPRPDPDRQLQPRWHIYVTPALLPQLQATVKCSSLYRDTLKVHSHVSMNELPAGDPHIMLALQLPQAEDTR